MANDKSKENTTDDEPTATATEEPPTTTETESTTTKTAPVETHAFGFRLRANAQEGQKRFPIGISSNR
jgi:hypothetical protein